MGRGTKLAQQVEDEREPPERLRLVSECNTLTCSTHMGNTGEIVENLSKTQQSCVEN